MTGSDVRAAVILGNDAVMAVRPASPAQLFHACAAAGFDIVVPPSWGDELVAGEYLDRLSTCRQGNAIGCACPRVLDLVTREGVSGAGCGLFVVPPPVAAARYLRNAHGARLLVTFVGDCPSGDDPVIDARFSPSGFLASLQREGITLDVQPNEFSAAEARRWRRYWSVPGGTPARRWLGRPRIGRVLRELDAAAVRDGCWRSSGRSDVLFDFSDASACACARDRLKVEEAEPPRGTSPVIVAPRDLDLAHVVTSMTRATQALAHEPDAEVGRGPTSPATTAVATDVTSSATTPVSNDVASSAPLLGRPGELAVPWQGVTSMSRSIITPPENAPPASNVPPAPQASPSTSRRSLTLGQPSARATRSSVRANDISSTPGLPLSARNRGDPLRPKRDRRAFLVVLPVLVVAMAAALGMAAYRLSSSRLAAAAASGEPSRSRAAAKPETDTSSRPVETSTSSPPAPTPSLRTDSAALSSGTSDDTSHVTPGVTAPPRPRRPARRSRVELVPGWMPQGTKAWTPGDTARSLNPPPVRPPRRDSVP